MTLIALMLAVGDGVPFIIFPIAMICDTLLGLGGMALYYGMHH